MHSKYNFEALLKQHNIKLAPRSIDTLQVNLTRLCNQVCRHCHVDSSPTRTEMLSSEGIVKCLEILKQHLQITKLDLTGGAPELHPSFDEFVEQAVAMGKHVMVRHNLTVQSDGNPQTGESKEYLPRFFAQNRVEVISSLPYYQAYFTDAQRGAGVFGKSITGLQRLNAEGYGIEDSGLLLNLVYNPVGPYLPPAQKNLEADFKLELDTKYGLKFNQLYTITNMPINRFKLHLEHSGQYEAYMERLTASFNPAAAEEVMCRSLISVDYDGRVYDCDFNQMLALQANGKRGLGLSIFDFDFNETLERQIRFADHCLGCTAGSGSSCGGATA